MRFDVNFQMDFRKIFRKALPYVVAVVVFLGVSMAYFAPQFGGKTLTQTDVQMYEGMKHDISRHRAAFDEDPQWTGGMFSGMPAYLITVQYPAMFLRNAGQWFLNLMGEPAALMFLAMLGFWLMLVMCGVGPWVAIPMALAYGLSTYNILIIEAGHITKMRAMGWAPMLVGAVVLAFRQRQPWVGGALAALFGALLIGASHHQITYYFLLVVFAYWIGRLAVTVRGRRRDGWWRFSKTTAVLALAGVLAVGANFTHLWYTFEHSPETTRGGSEVAAGDGTGGGGGASGKAVREAQGLDLQYATAWSYGVGESVNMFIPNFRGGASGGGFAPDGEVASALQRAGYPRRDASEIATGLPGYWGAQPFTGGPTYIGAVAVFLAILGMFILRGREKWWIFGVSVLGLLLAWGGNAMWFTQLAFDVMPGYNKFRTVSMALVVLQWSVPFMAALAMMELWRFSRKEADSQIVTREQLIHGLKWSLGIAGGVALFFALAGGVIYDFSAASDSQFAGLEGLAGAMRGERAAMFRADCWRSLVFVLLTAGVVWGWVLRPRMGRSVLVVSVLGLLVLADLVPVDLRFLSHKDFSEPARVEIVADEADLAILEDKEPGYRVFNTENPFNEAFTSYFHRSIGGYHGAKLRRYQDVIDAYLSKFDLETLNLLNTKYFIITDPETGKRIAEENPDANGAAWFVDEVVSVDGARAELDALAMMDNKTQAIVDQRFAPQIEGITKSLVDVTKDLVAPEIGPEIELVEYRPNYLRYESSSEGGPRLAVFSEIYYDKGWKAYLDGVETDYLRADYLLRAMVVPAGEHTIEWRFRAPRFRAVEGVTLGAGIAILVWLAAAIFFDRRKRN